MLDFQKIMNEISKDGLILSTTQILKSYGLNDYYIKKGVQEGFLKKRELGVYEISSAVSDKKRSFHAFELFSKDVLRSDYQSAYFHLKESFDYRVNANYDNHMRIYFLLLQEILGDKYDFSNVSELNEFCEANFNDSYYEYFVKFRYDVMSHDYSSAYHNMVTFQKMEYAKYQKNKISTELFLRLIEEVCKRNLVVEHKPELSFNLEDSLLQLFPKYYQLFLDSFLKGNYEIAYENLQYVLECEKNHRELLNIKCLMECYFDLLKSENILPELSFDFNSISSKEVESYFYQFLNTGDYLNAFLLFQKKQMVFSDDDFKIYQTLFQLVLNLHQKHKEVLLKKQKEKEAEAMDIFQIRSFILSKDYEKAKYGVEVLLKRDNDDKLCMFLRRLINIYQRINSFTYPVLEIPRNTVYENSTNIFKRFFEALRFADFNEAYECALTCDGIVKNRDANNVEFELYSYILSDILNSIENTRSHYCKKEEQEKFEREYNDYLHHFQVYDKKQLEYMLLKRQEYCSGEEKEYINYALSLNEMIDTIDHGQVCTNDFEQFSYSEKTLKANFLEAMKYGDYLSACDFIFSPLWMKENENIAYKRYFILYRKLLRIFKNKLNQPQMPFDYSISLELEKDECIIYSNLKRMIKLKNQKKDYIPAYRYYLENQNVFSEELQYSLNLFFTYAIAEQSHQARELYDNYGNAFKHGNLMDAKASLDSYKDFIEGTSANRNLDYVYDRIRIMEKDLKCPDFAEKCRLIDYSKFFLSHRQYHEGIEVLNQYIALDEDLNYIGYFLRGKAYEKLKNYKQARIDYEKALSISMQPQILFRLSRVCLFNHDFENALFYALCYEERHPCYILTNLKTIITCYQHFEDYSKVKEYDEKKYVALLRQKKLKMERL